MRRTLVPLALALLVSTSGCATLIGAGIGYAVNGNQGARRGAAAGAEVDSAIFASAAGTTRASRALQHYECEGIETPSARIELPNSYRSEALYSCEEEFRQACRCDVVY